MADRSSRERQGGQAPSAEARRLEESRDRPRRWKRWGPYLSERAWGTVREDYSASGTAWEDFPHDHARSRAYRWNEDGLAGICDRRQRICFAIALWNERDPILKERLFGLTGNQGNHGEDVKEQYFYLDSTPTHSYMKFLYKYPQAAFPYEELVAENGRRGRQDPEFELLDTGVFDQDRYFDVFVEYAKAGPEDILIRLTAVNRGLEAARLHVLPTIWFRNTWSWDPGSSRPLLQEVDAGPGISAIAIDLGPERRWLLAEGRPPLLFTENDTNLERLYGVPNPVRHVKDAFHDHLVAGAAHAINPEQTGTKAAAHHALTLGPGEQAVLRLRLSDADRRPDWLEDFDRVFELREREAGEFYATIVPAGLSADGQRVMRQALAGMLWSKQFYHYVVESWLAGDPGQPAPPAGRQKGRNHEWPHLHNADVIAMPDKWEYPWYAAWDLAFHCVALALADPDFAKEQLVLLLREWYMHPNGQLPAYEWALGDVNPPVHAWAALRVYEIEKRRRGQGDRQFLKRVFDKLLLNFTWWVNRKDAEGHNLFQGGFLGLDNIGVFDRSAPLPTGGHLEQADGTSWMAMYALDMLAIALELAREDPTYEDLASKFWEHFVYISHAMNHLGGDGIALWHEEAGFYHDVLHLPGQGHMPLAIRSMVGLIPLFAVESPDPEVLEPLADFRRRRDWFLENRPDLTRDIACTRTPGNRERRLLALADGDRLRRVLAVMLDEREFLSPYGIRAMSRDHLEHPFLLRVGPAVHRVEYEPGESTTGLFGGNSNWRGPIWFPVNYLIIEALEKFHLYYGDAFKVECPIGSGRMATLHDVAAEIAHRLVRIFLRGTDGRRPVHGEAAPFRDDPHWRDLVLFHEYFHGDRGIGLGASHQTGWTGLVANLLQRYGEGDGG